MIPILSIVPYPGPWSARMRDHRNPLVDYEVGGIAINDPSQGLGGYDWTAEYDLADGWVYVWREDQGKASKVGVLQRPGIIRIGLAFDQNMRVHLCWTDSVGTFLWRYSADTGEMVAVQVAGASSPCITMDDHRPERVSDSDIILSYISGTQLCFRVQRELYEVVHSAELGTTAELNASGMAGFRFQWEWR